MHDDPSLSDALAKHFRPREEDEARVERVMDQVRVRPIPAASASGAFWMLAAVAATVALLAAGIAWWSGDGDSDVRPGNDPDLIAQYRDAPRSDSLPAAGSVTEKAPADGWGHLTGRFVYQGQPPEPARLRVSSKMQDVALCAKHGLFDESLVVDPETKGVANVFVYLRDRPLRVYPGLSNVANEAVTLDNQQCRFVPHASVVHVGQTLRLGNSDPVVHNSRLQPLGDQPCNPLIPSRREVEYAFGRAQSMPVRVACSLHPWMSAWVLPTKNPYATISDQSGRFEIAYLPAGECEIQLWHERSGPLAARESWHRGRVKVVIRPGKVTDLGDILVAPDLLRSKKADPLKSETPPALPAPRGCCGPTEE